MRKVENSLLYYGAERECIHKVQLCRNEVKTKELDIAPGIFFYSSDKTL